LARRLNVSPAAARELLDLHRRAYPRFWRWSQAAVDTAMLRGELSTVFGWTVRPGAEANPRSLQNFPMQANGAEMMRLAACLATERGLQICAPIHDAFLLEAPADELDEHVEALSACMAEASRVVLDGFELGVGADRVYYPGRYLDRKWAPMFERVVRALESVEGVAGEQQTSAPLLHPGAEEARG
jgi:hypothetical protein